VRNLAVLVVLLALAPCSSCDESRDAWLIEWPDCTLASDATFLDRRLDFSGCRVYWSPGDVVTVELMTPGTTGSFLAPGDGWLKMSLSGASEPDTRLTIVLAGTTGIPGALEPDQVTFLTDIFGQIDGSMKLNAKSLDVSGKRFSLSVTLDDVVRHRGAQPDRFAGTIQISAAASPGSRTDGQPGDPAGPVSLAGREPQSSSSARRATSLPASRNRPTP
jgi:hypothetical protein